MSTAIAPARIAQILPLEVFSIERGGRNAVCGVNGRVASDIELLELDEETRVARYELRVANDSPSMLTCYAYAVRGAAGEKPVTCASVAVLPHSGVAVTFELPLPFVGTYDRITVEMHGDGVDVSSDTIPPGRNERLLVRRAVALAVAAVVTALAVVTGLAQPQILALSLPAEGLSGSRVHLAYEARGAGVLSYGLIGPDGETVAAGTTRPGVGDVTLPLPATGTSRSYLARLEIHNVFGGDAKTAVVRDVATPVPLVRRVVAERPASIAGLSVARTSVRSGETIAVSVAFAAERGTLRLLDDAGTVWAALPVRGSGTVSMTAPHVDRAASMRLALHVERGATSADSQVGVQLVPAEPPKPRFRPLAGTPLEIADGPLVAGAPIPLRVVRPVSGLHVSLQDGMGLEVEGFDVDGDQAALHAPARLNGNRYTVVVTFSGRQGQETVVAPIVLRGGR